MRVREGKSDDFFNTKPKPSNKRVLNLLYECFCKKLFFEIFFFAVIFFIQRYRFFINKNKNKISFCYQYFNCKNIFFIFFAKAKIKKQNGSNSVKKNEAKTNR